MSKIIISNGFCLKDASSLDDAFSFARTIQKSFNKSANTVWAKMIATDACILIDSDSYHGSASEDKTYITDAYTSIENDLLMSFKKNIKSQLDNEVLLYFQKSKIDSKIYGLCFINNFELNKKFSNLSRVSEFNFIEIDDNEHNIEYNKKIWVDILENTGKPTSSMFAMNIVDAGAMNLSIDDIVKELPNQEERAENLAKEILIKELEKDSTKTFDTNDDVWEYLSSDEHITKVKNLSELIYNHNPKHINKSLLRK